MQVNHLNMWSFIFRQQLSLWGVTPEDNCAKASMWPFNRRVPGGSERSPCSLVVGGIPSTPKVSASISNVGSGD